jgi:hypothetical protein
MFHKQFIRTTGFAVIARAIIPLVFMVFCYSIYCLETPNYRNGIEFSLSGLTIESGTESYLNFDVLVKGSAETYRIGTGIILLSYNPATFGSSVVASNNVIILPGEILTTDPVPVYRLALKDYSPGCLAVTFEYIYLAGFGNLLTDSFQQLLNIKLKITAFGNATGLSLRQTEMNLQQYKDDNSTLFSPVSVSGADNGFLTQTPLNPVLTEQNGVLTLSWQPVSGCVYNVYSSDFPKGGIWQLEALRLTQPLWQDFSPGQYRFYRLTSISSMERE